MCASERLRHHSTGDTVLFKTALLAHVRQLSCGCCAFVGRNRKWILEDNLSEAVWRTIFEGSTSSRRVLASCSGAQLSDPPSPRSFRQPRRLQLHRRRQGAAPGKESPFQAQGQPKPTAEPQPQRPLNPDEQLKAAAQVRVAKLEVAMEALEQRIELQRYCRRL